MRVKAVAYKTVRKSKHLSDNRHRSPDKGIVDPTLVPIGVFDVQPAVLALEDFKGNTFFNCKKDFLFGVGPGADIT